MFIGRRISVLLVFCVAGFSLVTFSFAQALLCGNANTNT